jgi:hypothetical protein
MSPVDKRTAEIYEVFVGVECPQAQGCLGGIPVDQAEEIIIDNIELDQSSITKNS